MLLSIYLFIHFVECLPKSIYLSIYYLTLYLSIYPSVHLVKLVAIVHILYVFIHFSTLSSNTIMPGSVFSLSVSPLLCLYVFFFCLHLFLYASLSLDKSFVRVPLISQSLRLYHWLFFSDLQILLNALISKDSWIFRSFTQCTFLINTVAQVGLFASGANMINIYLSCICV